MIDTDILIDIGRGVQEAVDLLARIQLHDVPAISVITQLELVVGCRNKSELRKLDKFIKQFQIIKLNEAISEKAVELIHLYRLSHGLLIADGLIAATALTLNLHFISKNQKDYKFISGLNLLPYP
ncbi:MAG: type II toxin-antitoxin system VapC family toxin [Candidatus Contendobacter sp.]|nr:type II toxin-antitoxin system VapC family toxin [Gammaproteobacteria bacterium]MCC8994212.1 type II toxin-antitoxin system VapC family toxin [Candidatus Contendobacter sp.]